jgi:hypothetical protein
MIVAFLTLLIGGAIREQILENQHDNKIKKYNELHAHEYKKYKELQGMYLKIQSTRNDKMLEIDILRNQMSYMPKQQRLEKEDDLELLLAEYQDILKEVESVRAVYSEVSATYNKNKTDWLANPKAAKKPIEDSEELTSNENTTKLDKEFYQDLILENEEA